MEFVPFSRKQMMVLTWWCKNSPARKYDAIICDGAVRSGKTLCMAISFIAWAFYRFEDAGFAMSGVGGVVGGVEQPAPEVSTPQAEAFCENCGAKLVAGSAFCEECGTAVPKDESKCVNCGYVFERPGKFCPKCGTKRG